MTNELSLACVYDSRIHGDHSQEIGDAGLFGLSCCLCQPQLCLTRGFFGPYYERYEGCPPAGSLDLHDRCSRVAPMDRHAMPMRLRSLAQRGPPATPRISYASYSCLQSQDGSPLVLLMSMMMTDDEQAVYIWKQVLLQ